MKTIFRLVMLMVPIMLVGVLKTDAQANEREAIVMEVPLDGAITFYAVNSSGVIREIGSLPDEFRIVDYQTSNGFGIRQIDDIKLAPNHEYVAFSIQDRNGGQVFIYRLSGEEIWSFPVNTPRQINWSPDSLGFLLTPQYRFSEPVDNFLAYFQLETQQTTILRRFGAQEFARGFFWIDNETFIYTPYYNRLDILSLDGERTPLFDGDSIKPNESTLYGLCGGEWSADPPILYLCSGDSSNDSLIQGALYFLTLDGNIKPILSPPPELDVENIFRGAFHIAGIEMRNDDTYIVINEYAQTFIDEGFSGENAHWSILKLRNDTLTTIYSAALEQFMRIENPQVSPNGRYLVVGMLPSYEESKLVIIDLASGRLVREIKTEGEYGWTMTWLNNYTFLYANSYDSAKCGCLYPVAGERSLLVDLSQYAVTDIGAQFDNPIWLFEE